MSAQVPPLAVGVGPPSSGASLAGARGRRRRLARAASRARPGRRRPPSRSSSRTLGDPRCRLAPDTVEPRRGPRTWPGCGPRRRSVQPPPGHRRPSTGDRRPPQAAVGSSRDGSLGGARPRARLGVVGRGRRRCGPCSVGVAVESVPASRSGRRRRTRQQRPAAPGRSSVPRRSRIRRRCCAGSGPGWRGSDR